MAVRLSEARDSCPDGVLSVASENESPFQFVEILPPPKHNTQGEEDAYVEAYIAAVEPQQCSALVKQVVQAFPSSSLSHLKRVRKREPLPDTLGAASDKGSNKRRKATPLTLEVLVGGCAEVDEYLKQNSSSSVGSPEEALAKRYNVQSIVQEKVPRRIAASRQEWEEFNAVWPTTFYPMKTEEHKSKALELSNSEILEMVQGIEAAIGDKDLGSKLPGAVVVSPAKNSKSMVVLAKSSDERCHQSQNIEQNPLQTPILLAIQGMSRRERLEAIGKGIDSAGFQNGHYLCTGCDLYTTQEPSVFEAMALVHARIRRVIFLQPKPTNSQHTKDFVGGLRETFVHALPGTNHKFRSFVCYCADDENK